MAERHFDEEEEYKVGHECDPVNALDGLNCGICHHMLRNAQQSTCCGQNACKLCIEKTSRITIIDKKCPFCSEITFEFVPDVKTQRDVDNTKIYCPNRQLGCEWTGPLRSQDEHVNVCPFTEVQCTNCCQQLIQRRQLEHHLNSECELRHECCKVTGTSQWITGDHRLKECINFEVNCYKKQLADIQKQLECERQKCVELQQKLDYGNKFYIENKKKLAAFHAMDWPTQLDALAAENSPGLPTIIKMPYFVKSTFFAKSSEDGWSSPSFTTDEIGYRMLMKVYANGYPHGEGYGSYVSVAVHLMKGDHDDDEQLNWPLKGTVKIQLLNQWADQDHSEIVGFKFNGRDSKMCDKITSNDSHVATRACWAHKFISHEALQYNHHQKNQYLKDKCIYFRIHSFSPLE